VHAPAPMPQFNTPGTPRVRPELVDPINWTAQHEGPNKIVNMLTVTFIDKDWAAGQANMTPIHKLGIKASLPKSYEGQPDQMAFENWLALLLGFFRIHQLDILNEAQDHAHVEILGQVLSEGTLTYFQEHHQKFMEVGENWDFREAILDLCDHYLYKITPFMAACKFEMIMQGNHDTQALYNDLSTQVAHMVEYPSDYHFRLRFMLALHPEVLDYIIKSHSVSAENSTLTQICSACVDFEQSYKYRKQVSATQAQLGGLRPPHTHNNSQNQSHIRNDTRVPPHSQHVHSNLNANKSQSAMAHLSGEGLSKNLPTCMTPKHNLKARPAHQHEQKTNIKKVSCFTVSKKTD